MISYISGNGTPHKLSQSPKKSQKIHPEKKSFYFWKWNFPAVILKKYIFSIKHFSYIFSKESFSYIFSKESFSYISGNGILHFSAQAREIKKLIIRNFLIFNFLHQNFLHQNHQKKILCRQ